MAAAKSEVDIYRVFLESLKGAIVKKYDGVTLTSIGGETADFGEILAHELHHGGLSLRDIAKKWGMNVAMLGQVIADHCMRLAGR